MSALIVAFAGVGFCSGPLTPEDSPVSDADPTADERPHPVYERVRLATFEVNLFIPRQTPERRVEQVLALLNDLDLRRRIEETVLYHLRERSFLKAVTAEVDE
jgi:hypothetical protein